ncbi:MAG TPA: GH116 family glycosyl-hydrolase [Fimbriimonas sp.]
MGLFKAEFDAAPYTRTGDRLREIAFPLGGIGTGCVSLDGRGGLRDWEIFGRPNKGKLLDFTFPALWFEEEGEASRALVVHGPRQKDFAGDGLDFWSYGHGRFFHQMDGLPHFDRVSFEGTFPIARVRFEKEGLPLQVELAALNPFIPMDTRSSSLPGATLVYRLTNRGGKNVRGTLAWSLMNPVGEMQPETEGSKHQAANARWHEGSVQGIRFTNGRFAEDDEAYGEATLATDWQDVLVADRWSTEGWWDSLRTFWNEFRRTGGLESMGKEGDSARVPGTLGCRFELAPGESAEIPFVVAWRFPNANRYWSKPEEAKWRAHYSIEWPTAVDAAVEMLDRRAELADRTLAFETALYDSTLPPEVLESVGATASILHSPTVIRLEDGTFWAWEGCSAKEGCCEGSCSHVWNYALTHAFLFPEIQRSMLDTAFRNGFFCGPAGREGAMNFRMHLPLGRDVPLWHAASDGQLGQIVQIYRDWRLTGDTDWLKGIYPAARKALRYAWVQWDRDQDGLVDGDMHNTYDINFCSPNPLTQFFYLAALRAMSKLGTEVGDGDFAAKCAELEEKGRALTEARLWNGEYFAQSGNFTDREAPKYQHGAGCLSDQVFGQLAASLAGLGDLVDPSLMESALDAIFRHNFRDPLGDHENLQRVYAFADEAGLILCSWPRGEEPAYPFVYSDEVWTGIEYQVATHLALHGRMREATEIARAIRHRYDGTRRNPWNEFECGSHYARALASYGLIVAFTGMKYDAVDRTLKFRQEPFKSLWAVPGAWGTVERTPDGRLDLRVVEGTLDVSAGR